MNTKSFEEIDEIASKIAKGDTKLAYGFWHYKTNKEKLRAAGIMTAITYNEPDFFTKRIDKTFFLARKHGD